jgi:hypothetical protein
MKIPGPGAATEDRVILVLGFLAGLAVAAFLVALMGSRSPATARSVTSRNSPKRRNRHIMIAGVTKTVAGWAESVGLAQITLLARLSPEAWLAPGGAARAQSPSTVMGPLISLR